MDLHWHYTRTEPFFSQGKDTTRPNFSREERSQVAILVREALQNPLDIPRDDLDGPIQVVLKALGPDQFDVDYLEEIFTPEFRRRLKAASGTDLPPAENAQIVVIEDFGTKGLIGNITDFNADGPDQNWNAFWHREGEGAKGRASNGGAGQGKVTYYAHSHASTVLGLTRRSTDSASFLMGRASFLRDYPFEDGSKYYRAAYWTASDAGPTPEMRAENIKRFVEAFRLSRDSSASGLSLVIPFAKPFDVKEAIKAVVLDFYMPIAANRLEVTIGDTRISSRTIDHIADRFIPDQEVGAARSSFTREYRRFAKQVIEQPDPQVTLPPDWNRDRVIPEAASPEPSMGEIRASLMSGRRVSIRLPLRIKRKNGAAYETFFDVHLETPPDLDRNEEAFVRRDLLIGAESHITGGSFVQKARSLTWIRDKDLSDFLLTAEEPTHLVWNASLARDRGEYVSPDIALRSIRQAVPRLLALLLSGGAQKDYRSLARFFTKPSASLTGRRGDPGPSKGKDDSTNPPPVPPPPAVKPFRIESEGATIRVRPSSAFKTLIGQTPVNVTVELAYEGLDQDPFEAYDPYDFDVASSQLFPVKYHGLAELSKAGNRIDLRVDDEDFGFEISGFDPNVRTRVRVSYRLAGNDDDGRTGSQSGQAAPEVEEAEDV
jgi:hypothetical protein